MSFQLLLLCYKTASCVRNEALFRREEGTYLAKSVIKAKQGVTKAECGINCSRESSCVSVNYKKSGIDQGKCELNDKLLEDCEENEKSDSEWDYFEIIQRVSLFYSTNK